MEGKVNKVNSFWRKSFRRIKINIVEGNIGKISEKVLNINVEQLFLCREADMGGVRGNTILADIVQCSTELPPLLTGG